MYDGAIEARRYLPLRAGKKVAPNGNYAKMGRHQGGDIAKIMFWRALEV